MVTRLLLARHGETTANLERRYSGHSDVSLTTFGRAQARALGRRLKREQVDAAYASDLSRAVETAMIALRGRQISVVTDSRLRELSFGDWEGRTFDEIRARWPEEFAQLLSVGEGFIAPGGEPFGDAGARVIEGLLAIIAMHRDESVLVVAHGVTLQFVFQYVLGMSGAGIRRLATNNCGLSIIEFHGERPFVTLVNDCSHLLSLGTGASKGAITEAR